jgi:ring-1,2-phenylacetyl-CoA epoxidase subunit PaaC
MNDFHSEETHDNAYAGLLDADTGPEAHWAFGTGFDDPLAGVDTSLPEGVDGATLATYCLMLGDDALVLAQRLGEWVAHGPELEEEVALANIGLDLLGQARLLYTRASAADPACVPVLPEGSPVPPEDALAFFRDADGFRNVRLVEQPRGDFAVTLVRLLAFSTWRLALLERLRHSNDPVLAAVAGKGLKEVTYHRDHAARWVVTLAQGTEESRRRVVAALDALVPWVDELFAPVAAETELPGVAVVSADTRGEYDGIWHFVLGRADLTMPEAPPADLPGGRDGVHTDHLDALLAELQSVAREHPLGVW